MSFLLFTQLRHVCFTSKFNPQKNIVNVDKTNRIQNFLPFYYCFLRVYDPTTGINNSQREEKKVHSMRLWCFRHHCWRCFAFASIVHRPFLPVKSIFVCLNCPPSIPSSQINFVRTLYAFFVIHLSRSRGCELTSLFRQNITYNSTVYRCQQNAASVMPDTRTLVQVEMIVVAISTQSTAIHEIVFRKEILCNCAKFTFSFFHIDTVLIKRNHSTSYPKANNQ